MSSYFLVVFLILHIKYYENCEVLVKNIVSKNKKAKKAPSFTLTWEGYIHFANIRQTSMKASHDLKTLSAIFNISLWNALKAFLQDWISFKPVKSA